MDDISEPNSQGHKTSMGNTAGQVRAMKKKEAIDGFVKEFVSLQNLKEHPELAVGRHLDKLADGGNHWFDHAIYVYRAEPKIDKDGRKKYQKGRWYDEVFPALLRDSGWTQDSEEINQITDASRKIGQDNLQTHRLTYGKRRQSMDKEHVLEAFRNYVISIQNIKDHPDIVSQKIIMDIARGQNGHWYHTALSMYPPPEGHTRIVDGKTRYLKGSWFGDVLPGLIKDSGLLTDAKEIADLVENARVNATHMGTDKNRNMTKEQVVEKFKEKFVSLQNLRENPTSCKQITLADETFENNGNWYSTACNLYKKTKKKKNGKWYDEALPGLLLDAKWVKDSKEALEVAGFIKEECRKDHVANLAIHLSKVMVRKFSKEQIAEFFKKDMVSLENILSNPKIAKDQKGWKNEDIAPWYNSANTAFRPKGKKTPNWYDDTLPALLKASEFCNDDKEIVNIVNQIKNYGRQQRELRIIEPRYTSVPQNPALKLSDDLRSFSKEDTKEIHMVMSIEWKDTKSAPGQDVHEQKPLINQAIEKHFGADTLIISDRQIGNFARISKKGDEAVVKSTYPLDAIFKQGLEMDGFNIIESNITFRVGSKEQNKYLVSRYATKICKIEEAAQTAEPLYYENHLYPEKFMLNLSGFYSRLIRQTSFERQLDYVVKKAYDWAYKVDAEGFLNGPKRDDIKTGYYDSLRKAYRKQKYGFDSIVTSSMLKKHKEFVQKLAIKERKIEGTLQKSKNRLALLSGSKI